MSTASGSVTEETVLVTGCSGFLAGYVVLQLLQQGYRVRGSVRKLARAEAVRQRLQAAGADISRLSFAEADLDRDDGWAQAAVGCDYVIHTASPFPASLPRHEDDLIRPAREGALRVLRAAKAAGVRRVVLTSSIAATNYGAGQAPFTESDWTDVTRREATPYYKSKTLAEQAAWAYARDNDLALAVINPGLILGPVLDREAGTSVELIRKLLAGEFPALPHFGIPIVDVRDVADAHIRAMTVPGAAGERFIAAGRFMWVAEVAEVLRRQLKGDARRVPRRELPDWLVRVFAWFDPTTRLIVAELSKDNRVSHEKASRVLGWQPRSEEETIGATATSLLAKGIVRP